MSLDDWNDFSKFADIKKDLIELIACVANDELFTADHAAEKAKTILEKVIEYKDNIVREFLQDQANKKQNRPNAVTLASTR
ncbi:hypothetical protein KIH86_03520 [Paenibacillus sp. HN-1]|uniref:hypothetical protein n=1 Tax=Paenibacillus TaxID=44249 RepID=UPI001CA9F99D|nr:MULTISPECIES: hypothetical protein [Paenibacillus]MBY9077251.1 hypothetical protein [Paenibacillus sp. CGMCC 1.18879]MBY9083298.1 hypothetical protein [Paenibacillus sinensis]